MTYTKEALVLRTCKQELTSHGGFQWPESGYVEAPDWNPEPICGGGLHGLLWAEGSVNYLNVSGLYQVVRIDESEAVWIAGDKVKFPRGEVIYCGADRDAAIQLIQSHPGSAGKAGCFFTSTAGDGGTAIAGYCGRATAGAYGTATAGAYGTATVGNGGTATAGDGGTLIIKHWDGARYRLVVGYVGEDGIKPNTPYKLDANGKFKEVSQGNRSTRAVKERRMMYVRPTTYCQKIVPPEPPTAGTLVDAEFVDPEVDAPTTPASAEEEVLF